MRKGVNKQNKTIFIVIISIIVFYFIFKRRIDINLMFLGYDLYALNGYYWKTCPEYCSPMKMGFRPVMPLEFYAEFNKAVSQRIPTGENNINKEEVIKICDRNLKWLTEHGKVFQKPIQIEIIHVDSPDFKTKIMNYIKNDYPFVIRGVNLKCFETMRFEKLMKKVGHNKVYMSPSSEKSCPDNIFTEINHQNEGRRLANDTLYRNIPVGNRSIYFYVFAISKQEHKYALPIVLYIEYMFV